jgi:ubiquitin carboxyl-terminal hydrolase 5/13
MFKSVIGKNHPEFSTMRQQDAVEFFQHVMTAIERDELKRDGGAHDPSKIFRFVLEERTQCSKSGKVKYVQRPDNILSLPIPLDQATNLGISEPSER